MRRNVDYTLLRDTVQEREVASWNKFFVFLVGETNEAHYDFVKKFKCIRHTEVNYPEECDYILVFCPVASRGGTDVNEALDKIPAGKPTILVVMHHTFNPDHVVAESRRLVNNPDVYLTVDCLFYGHKFLDCTLNDTALLEIKNYLQIQQVFPKRKCPDLPKHWIWIIMLLIGVVVLIIVKIYLGHMRNIYNKTESNEQFPVSH